MPQTSSENDEITSPAADPTPGEHGPGVHTLRFPSFNNVGYTLTIAAVVVYGLLALSGPHGIRALREKHNEIRSLEEQIAILHSDNRVQKEKIERLQDSQEEQDLEIRKQRKMLRPGEHTYILQDEPAAPAPSNQ